MSRTRIIRPRRFLRFKLVLFAFVLVSASIVGLAIQNRPASADQCLDNNQMLNCRTGYFYGRYDSRGNPVYQNGIPDYVDNANEFIFEVGVRMQCSNGSPRVMPANVYNTQEATGSAFIVMTMLGFGPGSANKNIACDNFERWAGLVRDYERAGLIQWRIYKEWHGNTYYQDDHSDVGYVNPGPDFSGYDALITFYQKGRYEYQIRRECANPVGHLQGLQPLTNPPVGGKISGQLRVSCDENVTGDVRDQDTFRPVEVRVRFTDSTNRTQVLETESEDQRGTDPYSTYPIYPVTKPDWITNGIQRWRMIIEAQDQPSNVWVQVFDSGERAPCIMPQANCGTGAVTTPEIDAQRSRFNAQGVLTFNNGNSQTNRSPQTVAQSVIRYGNFQPFIRARNAAGQVITNQQPPSRVSQPVNGSVTLYGDNMGPVEAGRHGLFWGSATGSTTPIECPGAFSPGQPGGGGVVFDAVFRPFFSVKGGDISAGGGIAASGEVGAPPATQDCSGEGSTDSNEKAGIVSWNKGAAAFAGAGTGYAALALGRVQDVATGQNSTYAPNGLHFANARPNGGNPQETWPGGTSEDFGGGFGVACTPNYFDPEKAVTGNPYMVNGAADQPMVITKDGQPGTVKERETIYVDGDAYITKNITFYKNGGYSNVADIPRFTLVVRGNIYIGKDVTEIHGVLVAQPKKDVTNSGIIYTCAPNGAATNASVLNQNLFRDCNQGLQIYGAVSAKQVWMLRTYGTVTPPTDGSRPTPSEHFYFTPEIWLNQPFTSDLSGKADNYNAVSSLPPIL